MAGKKYYWLKLDENFFEDDTIAWLEEQENGKDYVIFYLKLSLKSLQDNGKLIRYVGERLIPYDIKALAKLTNTPPDTVKVAMRLFLEIGLIKQLETGEIYMMQIEEMVGTETQAAQRMRRLRAKKNETGLIGDKKPKRNNVQECYTDVQKSYTEIEIEIEKDIEKDIEKEIEIETEEPPTLKPKKQKPQKHKYGEYQNVLLSDEEYIKLQNEFSNDYLDRIERVSEYCASTGKTYKNYLATIRNWAKKDVYKEQAKPKKSNNPFLEMMQDELAKQGGNPYE